MKTIQHALWAAAMTAGMPAFAGSGPANPSVQAFIDICVKEAPSFAGSPAAAAAHGIGELVGPVEDQAGFTSDGSLAVQIKKGISCTVTTESQGDRKLAQKLIDAVAQQTGQTLGKKLPLTLALGGEQFALMHDRASGEAFVLLSLKRQRKD